MSKKILLLIDVQNGFISTDETRHVANKITALLELNIFDCVIATAYENDTGSMYEKLLDWHGMKTQQEQEIPPKILSHVSRTVRKKTYNATNDSLIKILASANNYPAPKEIYIAGIDTDACVLATAIGLFEKGIRPIVLEAYCASTGGENAHHAGIECMKRTIGKRQIVPNEIHSREDLENI